MLGDDIRAGVIGRINRKGFAMPSPLRVSTPGWVAEFKAFIVRGNVVDLAVGIIIGAAFTAVLSKKEAAPTVPPRSEALLQEIRDALRAAPPRQVT